MITKETKLDEILEQAITAYKTIQKQTPEEQKQWLRSLNSLPSSIPLGDGRQVLTTTEGLKALHEFGRRWRAESPSVREAISEEKAATLSVEVFGRVLAGIGVNQYADDTSLKKVLKDQLNQRLDTIGISTIHHIPCQIFETADFEMFDVGPVTFRRRFGWLTDVRRTANRPLDWIASVQSYWDGRSKVPPFPKFSYIPRFFGRIPYLGKAALKIEQRRTATIIQKRITAFDVVESVGSCGWVASVEIKNRELGRSRECAEIAVKVALETLALPLHRRQAMTIRGPGDDLRAKMEKHLRQVPGQDINIPSRLELPRLRGSENDANELLDWTAESRKRAGEAIAAFLDLDRSSARSSLQRRWIEAMYWYRNASREPSEFVGLVQAGIALDILTKGKKAGGITTMCCDLFGVTRNEIVTSDGQPLHKLVTTIYDEGRSQIGHGGRLALLQDLPIARESALQLTALVLSTFIERVDAYSGTDDIDDFLKALPSLLPPRQPSVSSPTRFP